MDDWGRSRAKRANNNNINGVDVPIEDWCNFYGISTLDLALELNQHTPRVRGEKFKILSEKLLIQIANAGGVVNHNIPRELITVVTTDRTYSMTFDQSPVDRLNLILESEVKKEGK